MSTSSRRPWAANIDMYRKIPVDLMEGTRRGSILSYLAVASIVLLVLLETRDFFQSRIKTDLSLDRNDDPRVRLNFNITMMDLKCDYCVIDVVSVLGTDQNITTHVTKWQVDAEGVRRRYKGRNRFQKDIILYDEGITETLEEMHENGEDAVSLDKETFEYAKRNQDYLFVDFYASWCSHCRDLAPTWEALAEVMDDVAQDFVRKNGGVQEDYTPEDYAAAKKLQLPVMIAKIDCVSHPDVCTEQNIRAYPTLRLFVDGVIWKSGDYKGHRTLQEFVEWLQHVEEMHQEMVGKDEEQKKLHTAHEAMRKRLSEEDASEAERQWNDKVLRHKKRLRHEWIEEDHPACQLSGHLMLDRVPGNFHIQARSNHHDLAAHATNVSHIIHSLFIGDPMGQKKIMEGTANVPPSVVDKIAPFDGNTYITYDLHESYHHYLKVISTNVDGLSVGRRDLRVYQIIQNSQLAYYRNDVVPQAKFSFDLSPISVSYRKSSRHWYDYLTSIMAIVGGVFTVVGMMESSISAAVSSARRTSRY